MLDRPKRGFVPPAEDWFRGELRNEFMDVVSYRNVGTLIPELNVTEFIKLRDGFLRKEKQNSRCL